MTWDGALPDAPGGDPWRSLDLAPSVRRLAEEAASAAGLAVAEWLERAIHGACSKDAPEAAGEPMPATEPIRPAPPLDPWLAQLLAVTRRLPPMPAPSTESAPPPAAECVPAPPPEPMPPAAKVLAADAALEEAEHAERDVPGPGNGEPEAAPAPAATEPKPMPDLVAKLWAEPPPTVPDPFQNLEQQRLEWRHLLRLEPETSEASEEAPQSAPADAAEQEAPAPEAKPLPSGLVPPSSIRPAAQEQKGLEPAFADVLEKEAGTIGVEAVTLPTPVSVPWRPLAAEPETPSEGAVTRARRPLRLLLALVIMLCSLAAGVLTARYLLPNSFSNAGAHQTKVSLILTPPEGSPATATIASAGTSLGAAAPAVTALPPPSSAEPPKAADTDPSLLADRLQQKAIGGDAIASFRLGILYALGQGVQKDYPRAAALFRTAAERGVPEAEYNIAVMYGDGMGVERNVTQAIYWYRKAAAQGNPNAAFNLGTAYADGTGVPRDMATAAHWFRLAAGQGVVNALFNLGLLYERGTGVPASSTEAYAWYAAAAGRGDTGAAHRRDEIAAKFTPAQLTQARARAVALQRSLGLSQQDASASP